MSDIEIVRKFDDLRKQAESVGITVKIDALDKFTIADIPNSKGLVCFDTIDELSMFIYGYELGYKSGL